MTKKRKLPTSLKEAHEMANRPQIDFAEFEKLPRDLVDWFNGLYEVEVFTKSINGDRGMPNPHDYSKLKHRPWFQNGLNAPSGFAFADSTCAYVAAYAGSGSRLQFHEEADSDYAAKTFHESYKKVQLG